MARTKRRQRSYSAGERGRNRVRVFPDHETGIMRIEWREGGRRLSNSLKHRDFEKAKKQADEFAANYAASQPEPEPEPLTLGKLFEMYLEEVTPTKSERSRKHDRVAAQMFLSFLGKDREPTTLSKRDWNKFIRERSEGAVGPSRTRVSARTVERDLRFLVAVLNWATDSKDDDGRLLLERSPFRGLKPPSEKNPLRVVLTEEDYQPLLGVSKRLDWRFHVALVLAHETGHRIGAIRALRWSDVDLDTGSVLWRGENEKTGYEHVTPLTEEAKAALELARTHNPGIGGAPVLPAPKDSTQPVGRYLMRDWWKKAERLAKLDPEKGRGWHSLRRKFASDLLDKPLKVLCELGGWKRPETVLECYQKASQSRMREALEDRRRA